VAQTLDKYQATHVFYIHGHDRSESNFKFFFLILFQSMFHQTIAWF